MRRMKTRLLAVGALVAISAGFLAVPASAANSSVTNVVNDASTNLAWAGTETFGAAAYDTAVVTGDGTPPAAGDLTYDLYANGTCDSTNPDDLLSSQTVTLNSDGTVPNSNTTTVLDAGAYSFDATYLGDLGGGGTNDPSTPVCTAFNIGRATPTAPSISNLPTSPTWSSGGGFSATLGGTNSDGTQSVSSSTTAVCTTSGLGVTYVTAGQCTLTAHTASSTNYTASAGTSQSFTIEKATPTSPTISNIPNNPIWSSGGGFTATLSGTNSNGTQSVSSSTTGVCTTSGLAVTYVTAGQCTLTAQTQASTNYAAASGTSQSFTISQATPTGPTVTNIPTNATWSSTGGFTAAVGNTDSDGAKSVSSTTPAVCGASGLSVTYLTPGLCTLTAQTAASTNFAAATGSPQSFTIAQATPSPTPSITNIPVGATWAVAPGFTATLNATDSDGVQSVSSTSPTVCTADGLTVTYVSAGQCTLQAQTAASTDYEAATGAQQSFTIAQGTPTGTAVSNIPASPAYAGQFTATVSSSSDSTSTTVTSSTPGVCAVSGGAVVTFVNVGTCTLTGHVAADTNFVAATGAPQTFTVGLATPSTPTITNLPTDAVEFGTFLASVATTGDGATSVSSISTAVCTVGNNGHTVTFVGFGVCTLVANVAQGPHYLSGTGNTQSFPVGPAARGYWLVGSDGGIFSFGAANFYGSMGSTPLQRPVVGITPSASRTGYWLVASDGGIFSFGSSSFYGSIPEVGLHPAGSGQPHSLNAPIVAMVPSTTGHGYFMVASDGGVFAFGDAHFAGSCPGIGGCVGSAVSVMPDSTGNGYWLVTNTGAVYAFGDATFYGAPTPSTVPVVDAVATPDWRGYWLLYSNGVVVSFGDATVFGSPLGYVNAFNPATAIYPTADGQGYWVASGRGDVFAYGAAPYLGSEAQSGLNGEIVAAFGF